MIKIKNEMKRNNLLILYACSALLACGACGEGEPLPREVLPVSDALRIVSVRTGDLQSAGLFGLGGNTLTRSVTTTVETDGNSIAIYAIRQSDQSEYLPLDGINPATYSYSSSSALWRVSDPARQLRLPKSGSLNVYAWHPSDDRLVPVYQGGGKSYLSGINVLSSDDFSATNQADYLYPASPATVSVTSPAAFTLKHALAKLTFKVYKLSSLTDEMILTGIQVRDYSTTLQTGTDKGMLLKDGTFQGLNGVSTLTLTATEAQKAAILQQGEETGEKVTASPFCLVAPAPGVEYLSFQLTTLTGGQEQTFLTQQTDFSVRRWKAGEHHVITIVLDGMKATITGIQVYQWGDYNDTHLPIS